MLGEDLTPAVREAWTVCYDELAREMTAVRAWTKLGWKRSDADVYDPALGPYMFELSGQLEPQPEFRQPENPNRSVAEVTKL